MTVKPIARFLVSILTLAALASSLAGRSPRQKPPISLHLEAPSRPLKAGKPLVLRLTTRNTSDRAFYVAVISSAYVPGIFVHVRDQLGRALPLRSLPPPPSGKGYLVRTGSARSRYLKPEECLKDSVNVTDLYDLGRPGRYTIWVGEVIYRGPDVPNGLARSNTIAVTVVR